ncbi:MAG: DnaJ domain-containing protein [Actinomycetia bacterium]|nr:DnaJ domain-containing protein [Actinomycetes bacterium]
MQREWLEKDYYKDLGVSKEASPSEVTKAYRKLARELHPDHNPDDPSAEERFKQVSAAYDVLGDEKKRADYDEARRLGAMGGGSPFGGAGGGSTFNVNVDDLDLGDLLGGFFGRRQGNTNPWGQASSRGGQDLEAELTMSFDNAVRGVTTNVEIGDGAGGWRTVKVRMPKGVDDGQRIRLKGKGGPGLGGGAAGDLYVTVKLAPHDVFGRDGRNLTVTVPVSFAEATLGSDIKVPTFDGAPVKLRIPAGTPSGRTFRVKGRGVTKGKSSGDLLVTVEVTVPAELTDLQKEAVENLAAAFPESPRDT